VEPLLVSHPEPVLARGLAKLVADRCEFQPASADDLVALRQAVFTAGGAILRAGAQDDVAAYREAVLRRAVVPPDRALAGLYDDLPEYERLVRFRDLSARQVLEHYNVGLVQALLLRASALDLEVSSAEPATMRRLLKYLRFFRLLARITLSPAATAPNAPGMPGMHLHIDGPTSLFAEATRYGLQLACFFPAVCALETWALDAQVEWKGRQRRLRLDQATGLISHYRNFSAYVPEEIRLFHQHFRRTVTSWAITGETPFLHVGGQEIVFPDLSFRGPDGTVIHLELFHRWHAGPLAERLRGVARRPELPLILGVDQALARESELAAALAANPWFQRRGFVFRDYPTVEKTLACLGRAVESRAVAPGGPG